MIPQLGLKTEVIMIGEMSSRMWKILIIFIVLFAAFAGGQPFLAKGTESSGAQVDATNNIKFADIERNVTDGNSPSELVIKPRSMTEIYLSLGVLVFGLILVMFTGIFALRRSAGWDQESTRVFTISVIVTAGLFLITAGYSDRQIAPMFGLLGTIVGYLLGKSPPKEQSSKSDS
jgi:hypothetical protein